jgi:hypothetical protein
MLVWKSSKLTDGKKSKEPAPRSDSSVIRGAIDPKLKRDESVIEGPLRRDARTSFRSGATEESVKVSGALHSHS